MSEAELLETTTNLYGLGMNLMVFYVSVVTAYLVTAHFVGSELTRSQAVIVTALFVSFSGFATWGSYVFMNVGSHFLYKSQSYIVLRPDPLISPASIVIVVEILGILGSLTFMWDVRNRTRARRESHRRRP